MRKIIQILPNYDGQGGVSRVVTNLQSELTRRNLDSVIVSLRASQSDEKYSSLRSIFLIPFRVPYWCLFLFSPFLIFRIFWLSRAKDVFLISHGLLSNLIVAIVSMMFGGFKFVVFEHNSFSGHYSSFSGSVKKIFFRLIYRFADSVVCVSDGLRVELMALNYCDASKFVTIHNGFDIGLIGDLSLRGIQFESFDTDDFLNVVLVGRCEKQKNYGMLLDVARRVEKEKIKFWVAGEGSLRIDLIEKSKAMGIENIFFLGSVDNPFPLIRFSDVFLHLSLHESFGNVLVEALILNKHVIATNCPSGPSEILSNGKYGDLYEVDDVDGIVSRLRHFCFLKESGTLFDRVDLKDYIGKFSIKYQCDKIINLVDSED